MCTNPEYAYNLFYGKLMERYDKCLPKVSVRENYIGTKKPWITKGILKCRKVKNKLYRKILGTPSETNEKIYKRYRNKFNKIKGTAKKNYYTVIITKKLKKLKVILDLTGKYKSGQAVRTLISQSFISSLNCI